VVVVTGRVTVPAVVEDVAMGRELVVLEVFDEPPLHAAIASALAAITARAGQGCRPALVPRTRHCRAGQVARENNESS
jgi:hypothetical protein